MPGKKLFITGSTGYIGGSVLRAILKKYPEFEITALLRTTPVEFEQYYPQIKIVQGDFDDFNLIEKSAFEADIVIHAGDIDHNGCINAILSGLAKKTTPSFLFHLTGTGCISDELYSTWEGKATSKIWNDIDDIEEIYNLPENALHHAIDKIVMDATTDLVKTACICPSDVYGHSTGISTKTTFLVPFYVRALQKTKQAFYSGAGENIKSVIHVEDLVSLFLILIDHALRDGGEAQWGREGFYFAVSGEVLWKEVAEAIRELGIQNGWLHSNTKMVSWNAEQIGNIIPHWPRAARYLWAANTRAVAARAARLGWVPKQKGFWDQLEEDVAIAAFATGKLASKA